MPEKPENPLRMNTPKNFMSDGTSFVSAIGTNSAQRESFWDRDEHRGSSLRIRLVFTRLIERGAKGIAAALSVLWLI